MFLAVVVAGIKRGHRERDGRMPILNAQRSTPQFYKEFNKKNEPGESKVWGKPKSRRLRTVCPMVRKEWGGIARSVYVKTNDNYAQLRHVNL